MNIAILGYGTIGSGVYELFTTNAENVAEKAGECIKVKRVLDLRDFPGDPAESIITHDFKDIADDPEIDVVVETMGGVRPAYAFVKECLEKGKSVCTSNKELVAAYGAELLAIAGKNNINFLFEAAVGGAIPIIRPINESFSADEIVEICGIVNGTTNYILTKMDRDNADFSAVLREAQDKGYAERNPEADVEGHDAGRKIAILSSLAVGAQVDYEDVYMEGITKISAADFKYAHQLNRAIKLIATMKRTEEGIYAYVSPVMVHEDNPVYNVNGVYNGILVKGKYSGKIMFYGRGAGKLPTASAVAADVVECVRHRSSLTILWDTAKKELADMGTLKNKFMVRVPENEAKAAVEIFGNIKELKSEGPEYAFVTELMREKDFAEKAKKLTVINRIRVE